MTVPKPNRHFFFIGIAIVFWWIVLSFIITAIIHSVAMVSSDNFSNANPSDKRAALSYVSNQIGVDVTNGNLYDGFNDHNGPHGDGTAYLEIKLPDSFTQDHMEHYDWLACPIPKETAYLCNLIAEQHSDHLIKSPSDIKNGHYLFLDNSPDPSFNIPQNYIIAVYEADQNILYYYLNDI